jgi:hypothetical protein
MSLKQRREFFRMAAGGKKYAEIHPYLQREFGNKAFEKTTVYKWIAILRCREADPKVRGNIGQLPAKSIGFPETDSSDILTKDLT